MIIKYPALASQLQKKQPAVYVVMGQDNYLLNESANQIKTTWKMQGECDMSTWSVATADDWSMLMGEANSYSLFAEHMFLDVHYDKKTIDAAAKACINYYSSNPNPRSLILIRAPHVPPKQWQWLARHESVIVVQATPFTPSSFIAWIVTQFKEKAIHHEPAIPNLMMQYTQGNLLACSQLIEKLALIYVTGTCLTTAQVMEQLSDQCEYQLYELADACLLANTEKAIHLLRYAQSNKTEATLVLWLLTQEIRQLIQLTYLLKQSLSFSTACSKLNIWSQRTKGYQLSTARLSLRCLYQLLQKSQQLDEAIKTSQNDGVWDGLEQLAIGLSIGTSA